jgi:hypothetical protein
MDPAAQYQTLEGWGTSQLNTHAYRGTPQAELRNLAAQHGKRLWMSEYDFEYSSEWSFKGGEPAAFTGDNHWRGRRDDAYRVYFHDTGIRRYASRDPNHGIAVLRLDDGDEQRLDLYAPRRADQVQVYSSPVLPRSHHVLTVRATGDKAAAARHVVVRAARADIIPREPEPATVSTAPEQTVSRNRSGAAPATAFAQKQDWRAPGFAKTQRRCTGYRFRENAPVGGQGFAKTQRRCTGYRFRENAPVGETGFRENTAAVHGVPLSRKRARGETGFRENTAAVHGVPLSRKRTRGETGFRENTAAVHGVPLSRKRARGETGFRENAAALHRLQLSRKRSGAAPATASAKTPDWRAPGFAKTQQRCTGYRFRENAPVGRQGFAKTQGGAAVLSRKAIVVRRWQCRQ